MKKKFKIEKEKDWAKAKNFTPKKGELIIYDCDGEFKLKVGDGVRNVNDLEFSDSQFSTLDGLFILREE